MFVGLVHKFEMGNIDGLKECVRAGIHRKRFKKSDGLERERVEEVGAAMLVGRNGKAVKAKAQVHECKA